MIIFLSKSFSSSSTGFHFSLRKLYVDSIIFLVGLKYFQRNRFQNFFENKVLSLKKKNWDSVGIYSYNMQNTYTYMYGY